MKTKLGILLMAAGILLLAASGGLFIHNQSEQLQAEEAQIQVLPKLVSSINQAVEERNSQPTLPVQQADAYLPEQKLIPEMTVTEIDGYGYIGFLSIPELQLELSVMADWSYPQLQKSPCRYSGNVHGDDLVISAHNYWKHFGQLKNLPSGSLVVFTDMDGTHHSYEVVATEILPPDAVEEMTAGEYDLTLFTCTYGGENRVTLRCDRI